jgi:hypothetical protein
MLCDSIPAMLLRQSAHFVRTEKYSVLPVGALVLAPYQCDETDLAELCIRDISAGEQNGSASPSLKHQLSAHASSH